MRGLQREDLALAAVLAVVVVGVGLLGSVILIQKEFDPRGGLFGIPHRIPTCGRSYVGGDGTTSLEQIEATITPGYSPVLLEPVLGMLPLWAPFETKRVRLDTGEEVCDTVVFLHVGPDAYASYGLEGGP